MGGPTKTTEDVLSAYGKYKELLKHCSDGLPVKKWEPLKAWPVKPHVRQKEIEEFKSLPSWRPRCTY